ncbi:MAG: Lipopolysaccharide export system permease protein LptG [Fluviibacter phosphoraccumulans EoVTN8]
MIYRKYVGREVLMAILLILGAFMVLFAFFDLMGELGKLGEGGYKLYQAIVYVALIQPGRIYELMPICVLIGTLYALSNLARHSEINVLRVSGVPSIQLLTALMRVGLALVLVTFLLGEFVVAPAEQKAQEWRVKAMSGTITQGLQSGVWVKDDKTFANINALRPDSRLESVRIYQFRKDMSLDRVSYAKTATFQAPDTWMLNDVSEAVLEGQRVRQVQLANKAWQSAITPDVLQVLLVRPHLMSIYELSTYIQHLKRNGLSSDTYVIAIWKKVFCPLSILVMMALALPFAYRHDRVGGVSLRIFAGVMIGALFYMLNGLVSSLGAINNWSPFVTAAMPMILFMGAAVTLLKRAEKR